MQLSILAFTWQAIARQRLRSLLALLAVAAGALALISVASVEESWQRNVASAFTGLNLNQVTVSFYGNPQAARLRRTQFTDEDVAAIRQHCPEATLVTASSYGDSVDVHAGRNRANQPLALAVEPDYFRVHALRLLRGRLPGADEFSRGARVCTISRDLAGALFPGKEALGMKLRLQGTELTVVGIVAAPDEIPSVRVHRLYFPRRLYRSVFHSRPIPVITAWAVNPDAAVQQINALLHRRIGGDDNVWYAASPSVARGIASDVRRGAQAIGFLAALCILLLGGYGAGSALYASAIESGREIGIRRALGADRLVVASEVLLGGLVFGLAGAAVGIALSKLGVTLAAIAGTSLPLTIERDLAQRGGVYLTLPSKIAPMLSWHAVLLGAVFSPLLCMLAALAPAFEIASLAPARAISLGLVPNRPLRLSLAGSQIGIAVALIALFPCLFEALDGRDRQEARRAFSVDAIKVKPFRYDLRGISLQGDEVPPGWKPEVAAGFKNALTSPNLRSSLLAACPKLRSVEPTISFIPGSVRAAGKVLWPAPQGNHLGYMLKFVSPTYYPQETQATAHSPGYGRIKYGRFFTDEMARLKAHVCVLDSESARVAFGEADGVGQTVRVNGVPLQVVGTMAGGGMTRQIGDRRFGSNGYIFVPLSTYKDILPLLLSNTSSRHDYVLGTDLVVHAADEGSVPAAAQELRRALPAVLPGLGEHLFLSEPTYGSLADYFALRAPAARRSAFLAIMLLLVALTGLANALLVSLGEMRRELSIRRALGAQRWHVMLPMVAEGGLLALCGSAAGTTLAWLLSVVVRVCVFRDGTFSFSVFWASAASLVMVTAALLVSLIPALGAARTHPARALR